MSTAVPDPEQRVLLRLATAKDALMTCDVLHRAGIIAKHCANLDELIAELAAGAGALMLSEETLTAPSLTTLIDALIAQPPWSDILVIVLATPGADSHAIGRLMDRLPNVTVIERPVRIASLVSAARSALRSRRRQYEIRGLLEDLHETDRRKTEFLATLAHELRNPLAPLRTALTLLARHNVDPASTARHYELMNRQIDHMVRLVDDLMEVSRITRGKVELQLAPTRLDGVLADAAEQSRPVVEAARHEFIVHCEDEDMTVSGDAVRLIQIISNLLNNAGKYTPPGGRIEVTARRKGDWAEIEVADSGNGLPADMLESVFDMFVQVAGTARSAQGGLGIGLTLVKSLVALHGGTVKAASRGIGKGSTFTVGLPLIDGKAKREDSKPSADASKAHELDLSVLVVDDNRDAADSLVEALKLIGASAQVVYEGFAGLRAFESGRFDAAVIDIGMPGMDGYELARRLRASAKDGRPLTLIALTGWGQSEDLRRATDAGFDHHVLKPMDFDHLSALLLGGGGAETRGSASGSSGKASP